MTAPCPRAAACSRRGRGAPSPQLHVFRNQSVGRTWSDAASFPRFATVIRIRMSSGPAFAYSTKTSK